MEKEGTETAFPSITPETFKESEALIKYIPLAEMIARKELKSMPQHAADFRELVNTALIKINSLIHDAAQKQQTYNPSYIIQGAIWEIRNQGRKEATQRGDYRGYTSRQESEDGGLTFGQIREAVVETVLSLDDNEFEVADENMLDPATSLELAEMKRAMREAIALLPENHRQVVEMRFFRGMKGTQIADLMGISSARVTKIIHDALETMRKRLEEKRML